MTSLKASLSGTMSTQIRKNINEIFGDLSLFANSRVIQSHVCYAKGNSLYQINMSN